MANYQLFIEYTKADDLRCVSCRESVTKGTLTIGCLDSLIPNNGEYYHFKCFFSKSEQKSVLKSEDPNFPPFEGYESLKAIDKEKVVKSIIKVKETFSFENEGKTESEDSKQKTTTKGTSKIPTQNKTADKKTQNNGEGPAIHLDYKEEPFMYKLSADPLRFAKISNKKNKVLISINEYYIPQGSNKLRPSFSGVNLTDQEWQRLGRYRLNIDEAIAKTEATLTEPKEKKAKLSHGHFENTVYGTVSDLPYKSHIYKIKSTSVQQSWKLSPNTKLLLKRKTGDVHKAVLQFQRGVFSTSESPLPSDWDYFEITSDQWAALHQHRDDINCDLDEHFDVYSYDY